MDGIQAVVLGVVQALTEFLPVSSSAHLLIIPKLLHWPYMGKAFDVALHFGTLLALVVFFRKDILNLLKAFCLSLARGKVQDNDARLAWLLLLTTIPAAVAGKLFDDAIESFNFNLGWIGAILIVFAGLLWLADSGAARYPMSRLSWGWALVIGLAQALALIPGVSRSGITLTAGRFLQLERGAAARYSFLASIPIVAGAALLEGVKLSRDYTLQPFALLPFVLGILASALAGAVVIGWFFKFLQRYDLKIFVWYRIALGVFLICCGFYGFAA